MIPRFTFYFIHIGLPSLGEKALVLTKGLEIGLFHQTQSYCGISLLPYHTTWFLKTLVQVPRLKVIDYVHIWLDSGFSLTFIHSLYQCL